MEPDGVLYDAGIPNFYDPDDFPFQREDGNYLLYLARVTQRKGIEIALGVALASNLRLVIAGQGVAEFGAHKIVTEDGCTSDLHRGAGVQYVGSVGPMERARLMGSARGPPTTHDLHGALRRQRGGGGHVRHAGDHHRLCGIQ